MESRQEYRKVFEGGFLKVYFFFENVEIYIVISDIPLNPLNLKIPGSSIRVGDGRLFFASNSAASARIVLRPVAIDSAHRN